MYMYIHKSYILEKSLFSDIMLVFHCKCRKAEESSKINDFEYKKRLQFVNVILFCSKVIENALFILRYF